MNIKNMQISFSYFGSFDIFSNEKRIEISNTFSNNYRFQIQNQIIGQQVQPTIIADNLNNTFKILFTNNRIDIIYTYSKPDEKLDKIVENIIFDIQKDIINIFGSKFNRVALNVVDFVFDSDEKYLQKFTNAFSMFENCGKCSEFDLRLNYIFKFNEVDFNSIINIKFGKVSNTNSLMTNEEKALILLYDINSVVGELEKINDISIDDIFNKLIDNYNEKNEIIESFLE